MSRITLLTAATAIALGLAALVNVAHAADNSTTTPQQLRQARMAEMCADRDARQASQLAYVETKLKLTDAQKAEFAKLAAVMKSQAQPMAAMCAERANPANLSTLPERMDSMQKMAEARAEAMRQTVPAMKAFYASLTLDQQKQADQLMPGLGGGGKGMGMGMGMGMGHGRHHGGGWGMMAQ